MIGALIDMELGPDVLLAVIAAGIGLTAFAALGAQALRHFSRHDLEEICRRKGAPERFSEILREDDRVALGVESVVVASATLSAAAGICWVLDAASPTLGRFAAGSFLLVLVLAAATLWVPRAVARVWGEPILFFTWPLWRLLALCAEPLVAVARLVDVVLHRLAGRPEETPDEESFEEEIRTIVSEGQREGLLEEDAREMIEGVIELGDADVSQIMTPRTEMIMLPVDLRWDELLPAVIEARHTRIPMFDQTRDDIVGVLHSKDLLPELARPASETRRPMRELLRPPIFVPETKAVDDLLEEFQQNRNHLAIVLDEYGGVSGLVTIEDVLEEIVGEIVDEYDQEIVEEINRLGDDVCEAMGRAHVDEINDLMRFSLPDDGDFDTIGGFVFSELGRIPAPGESLVWNDTVRLTVLDATHRRINRVRIERIEAAARETA